MEVVLPLRSVLLTHIEHSTKRDTWATERFLVPLSLGKVVCVNLRMHGIWLSATCGISNTYFTVVVGDGLKLSCSHLQAHKFLTCQVCQRVAELYPKNYYAWTQRSWVVLRAVGGARADTGAGQKGVPGEDTPTSPAAAELVSMAVIGDTRRLYFRDACAVREPRGINTQRQNKVGVDRAQELRG